MLGSHNLGENLSFFVILVNLRQTFENDCFSPFHIYVIVHPAFFLYIHYFFFLFFFFFQDDHKAFRRQLEDKRPIVESNLLSGRQYIASEPPVSDTSDTEGKSIFVYKL